MQTPRVLLTSIAAASVLGAGPTAAHADVAHETRRALHAGAPGVVVAVADQSRTRAYRAGRAPAGEPSFRIGSISKTYLATVVMQLVQERRIGLDDTLARHLPGVLPRIDEAHVTVRMLLDHTSGVPDPTRRLLLHPGRFGHGDVTAAKSVGFARDMPPTHAPGTRFSYSNTDYGLLAMLVEQVTHRPYADAIRARVLAPLHLRRTVLPTTRSTLPVPFLRGFSRLGGKLHDTTRMNATWAGASGGIVATAPDVARFVSALNAGRLLRPATLAAMRGDAREAAARYGLGLQRWRTPCGRLVYGHSGGMLGYASRAAATADGRRSVAVGVATDETPRTDAAMRRIVDAAICGRAAQ